MSEEVLPHCAAESGALPNDNGVDPAVTPNEVDSIDHESLLESAQPLQEASGSDSGMGHTAPTPHTSSCSCSHSSCTCFVDASARDSDEDVKDLADVRLDCGSSIPCQTVGGESDVLNEQEDLPQLPSSQTKAPMESAGDPTRSPPQVAPAYGSTDRPRRLGHWTCGGCTLYNTYANVNCYLCATPRPTTNDAESDVLPARNADGSFADRSMIGF